MSTKDPIDELTIAELDAGSRLLKGDMMTAVSTDSPNRAAAMAVTAWLLARRTDRAVQLNTYRAMTLSELLTQLGIGEDDDQVDDGSIVVSDAQLASAAAELGVDVVELVTALQVDAVEPVVDDAPTDDQLLDDEQQIDQLESDPTDPAPAP